MRYLGLIVLIIAALVGFSFAVLNSREVVFDYYIDSQSLPLSFLLVGAFILGIIIGLLALLPNIIRLKHQIRHLRHRDKM